MMLKLKSFFARVHDMNFKTMWMMISKINEESGIPKAFIFVDMVFCALRYGVGYLEYRVFGWAYIRGKKRQTFMKMQDNIEIYQRFNDKDFRYIFEDKIKFNEKFSEWVGRDFLDLRVSQLEDFENFCKEKKYIFAKETDGFGGVGARKIDISEFDSGEKLKKLYYELKLSHLYVVEECVVQCEKMNELCPSSINTIRMVTLLSKNGKPHLMYSLVRMGNGTKPVDNISSGGMYAPVDENGVIFKPAFCDKTGEIYEIHPFTKTRIVGFKIPFYNRAVEIVKEAALKVPQIGYVGWDVAMTDKGPILIEGNTLPGYDMPQNYYHLRDDKTGILKKFKTVLEE